MKCIALTMLEQSIPERGEERDAIDRRWTTLLDQCGLGAIFLPNDSKAARRLLETIPLVGAILTGGGQASGGWAEISARDLVEREIEAWSTAQRLPLLGICRGMQALLAWEDIAPLRLEGHVRVRHSLDVGGRAVNSYHEYGFKDDIGPYRALARAQDGSIEWIEDPHRRRMGVMWHPERESPFDKADIRLIADWFNHGLSSHPCGRPGQSP